MDPRHKNKCFLAALLFIVCIFLPHPVNAELKMKRLSEFQNGAFHIGPDSYPDSEFDKSDPYIDDEQADIFIAAARVEIYLPADHDNYPFSMVDHQITDDDVEIFYTTEGQSILRPYPRTMYLSRHNISIEEYTNMKEPPAVFQRKMTNSRDPIYDAVANGVAWQYNDSRIFQPEFIHYSVTPGEEDRIRSYLINGEVITRRGVVAVWKGKDVPPYKCPPVKVMIYPGKCKKCP